MNKILVICLIFTSMAFSQNLKLQSNEERTNIIELYTSQGCSSCPVADEWLNELKQNPNLFKTFIPMAFHVTYWDFIGWKDTFGNVLHDNRQRYYAARVWKKNSVYTPQFVINAKEYRQWFSNQRFPSFQKIYGGILKANINESTIELNFENKKLHKQNVYVNMAILGFDYKVQISSGENEDRELLHNFVVLNHHQQFASISNGKLRYQGLIPKVKDDENKKAIAIWISDEKNNIIQAVAGYF